MGSSPDTNICMYYKIFENNFQLNYQKPSNPEQLPGAGVVTKDVFGIILERKCLKIFHAGSIFRQKTSNKITQLEGSLRQALLTPQRSREIQIYAKR